MAVDGFGAWHQVVNGSGVPSVSQRLYDAGIYHSNPPGLEPGQRELRRIKGDEFLGVHTCESACEQFLDGAAVLPAQRVVTQRPEGSAPVRSSRIAGAPRQHSVRPVIWAAADEMWEAAGKPRDIKVVIALRQKIMTALEDKGVKRTSSSTELGNWMKTRLASG